MADSPDANPAFAIILPASILAPMAKLEIDATQPRLISQLGKAAEIAGCFVLAKPALRDWCGQLTLGLVRTGGVEQALGRQPRRTNEFARHFTEA